MTVRNTTQVADGSGRTAGADLPWERYTISVVRVPRTHYVKEMRYNHEPVTDGAITLADGAELEIVLEDRPASISGTVKGAANVAVQLRSWPLVRAAMVEGAEPYSYMVPVNPDRTFQIPGLAPGEYRIRAVDLPFFGVASDEGEKIVLAEGEQKTVELRAK